MYKMKCFLLLLFFSAAFAGEVRSQVIADSTEHALPAFKEYRFPLPEKAIDIIFIEHEKSKVPIHGKLAPDGKSVILRNYQPGQPVRVKAMLENGRTEEFVKSPCFIDPVIQAL